MATWILGDGHIDFSYGTIKFAWASWEVEAICEKQTLQGRGVNPRVLQRGYVIRFELEQSSLRDQYLRIRGRALMILLQVELISLPGIGKSSRSVSVCHRAGTHVALQNRSR